jgi:DnaK suppressor protein
MASPTRAAASKKGNPSPPAIKRTTRAGKVPAATAAPKASGRASAKAGARPSAKAPAAPARTTPRTTAGAAPRTKKTTTTVRKTATKETVKSAVTSSSPTTEKKKAPAAAKAPARTQKSSPPSRDGTARTAAKKAGAKAAAGPYAHDDKFLLEQRHLLEEERAVYQNQASDLKAEADSLAQEREPGDVQFDEESGEGGTVTVDRERDLALSAQALAAVEEIDAALGRIADRTYGECERCHQPIPKPRLKALPFARLCVACKSGGLSRR